MELIIGLSSITESPTNPRKYFDQGQLEELAESIKAKGVLDPIKVRPIGGKKGKQKYEIIDGARRFRASQLAGISGIPAFIVEMSDVEVQEAQLISFIQRADITPLEEADAFEQYAQGNSAATNKDIGILLGKSAQYVAQRRQLKNLIPKFVRSMEQGEVSLASALEIAKLTEEQQTAYAEGTGYTHGEDYRNANEVANEIRQMFYLSLSSAPFSIKKPNYSFAPPSCQECSKRSSKNIDLFGDTKDYCLDGNCFNGRVEDHIETKLSNAQDEGKKLYKITERWSEKAKDILRAGEWEKAEKKSEYQGIFIDGERRGHVINIKLRGKHTSEASGDDGEISETRRLERYERRMELHRNRIEQEVRVRMLRKLMSSKIEPTAENIMCIVLYLIDHASQPDEILCQELKIKKDFFNYFPGTDKQRNKILNAMSIDHLLKICIATVIHEDEMIKDPNTIPECVRLDEFASRLNISRDEIAEEVTMEMKSKEPKKPS